MRLILSAVWVLVLSIALSLFLTPRQVHQPTEVYNVVQEKIEDKEAIIARFQKAITFPTVSDINAINHVSHDNLEAFNQFLSWVRSAYPLTFKHLEVEQVSPAYLTHSNERTTASYKTPFPRSFIHSYIHTYTYLSLLHRSIPSL